MGKMTFVVEFEDGKEPAVNKGTDILGGQLIRAAFRDSILNVDNLNQEELAVELWNELTELTQSSETEWEDEPYAAFYRDAVTNLIESIQNQFQD
ncbi:hypothetical protein [Yersinia ruckeri]|uniref:hypothetical protein n=1 Tax=Yersinia ruckeri TaxID=29486 RepID=UPI0008FE9B01|nr:hypothetical protein [Yersinia ruckeri]OJB95763.1 hypothetical protein AXW59_07410 [Yersinia ruckeri]OJB98564.1 hypothetical protein AXW58_07390 [Yersinia ruckeri]OJC00212.1 hypothetical protein AXW57_07405 [Yersinia ruckeri]